MSRDFESTDRFELRDDLVVEEVDDEVIVLDLAGNKYFGLNGVAWDLWQSIEAGDRDLAGMATAIAEAYEIDVERARADAEAFIADLVEAGLATRRTEEDR